MCRFPAVQGPFLNKLLVHCFSGNWVQTERKPLPFAWGCFHWESQVCICEIQFSPLLFNFNSVNAIPAFLFSFFLLVYYIKSVLSPGCPLHWRRWKGMFSSFSPKSRRFSEGVDTTQRDWLHLMFLSTQVRTANRQTKVYNGLRAVVNWILISDEDRLSKRKSIGETISLQGEVESRNSPEKEEVKILYPTSYNVFYLPWIIS